LIEGLTGIGDLIEGLTGIGDLTEHWIEVLKEIEALNGRDLLIVKTEIEVLTGA
jgi:hypothetical protein